jgi:hypothetical protein
MRVGERSPHVSGTSGALAGAERDGTPRRNDRKKEARTMICSPRHAMLKNH